MKECILAVSLLLLSSHINRHSSEETVVCFANHRGKFVTFHPDIIFIVSKSNNVAFCAGRISMFILFDCLYHHGRKDADVGELVHVMSASNSVVRVLVVETGVFFTV